MESLYTSVINFFVQDDWNYTEVEEGRAFKVAVDLDNSNYNCYVIINEEKRNFKFYSISPVKVPENKYTEMAEFFTRANYGMNLGNFEMDFRDGEIRYKTS
ncbi:MAG: YbjN domain-containing protein, partial [Mastigocoleus sp. MO_167.B18]|nr:YbjN domain-containing protein [Mastigocoleus sp. MO_167.B18]